MLLLMVGLLGVLGLVEIGYLYYARSDLQKVVDLAAIAGAQRLDTCNPALSDNLAARKNAEIDNSFNGTLTIRCGYWDSANGNVVSALTGGRQLDAVQVDASKPAIPFFGQNASLPMVRARAIARSGAPIAAFSVGSRLLDVTGTGPLQGLLQMVGIDLTGTEVASFSGLANVKVTPAGLLQALGIPVSTDISVGELNNLLAARQVKVGDLLSAVSTIGSQQGVANVNVNLLRNRLAQVGLDAAMVRLGSATGTPGLFTQVSAGTASASSALNVNLNALSLVTTSIEVANARHAVAIPGLNLLGVLEAKASVVEPPSIAIGPVGTTAYNSQVRLFLDIDTSRTVAIGSLLNLLGVRLKLPIYVDVVDGYGRLESINCSTQPAKATIGVTSTVANVCVGKAVVPWNSTRELCATGLQNEEMVKLLGVTVLNHQIKLAALSDFQRLVLGINESGTVSPNSLALGTLVSNLVDTLLGTLGSLFSTQGSADTNAKELAKNYLEATKDQTTGLYNADRVISALKNGAGNLPALGTWQTDIIVCTSWVLFSSCKKEPGDVWVGYKNATTVSDPSLLGGLLDVLGVTACDGLLAGLLAYNTCLRDNLAKSLQTKPGGLQSTGYNPVTGNGTCNSVLCLLLKPLVDGVLRPLLDGVGSLLSSVLSNVLGLNLGRSVVTVHDIRCGNAELVY